VNRRQTKAAKRTGRAVAAEAAPTGSSDAPSAGGPRPAPTLAGFQRTIEATYLERDRRRGLAGTFVWFVEEVGELARAIKRGEPENLREEFGDVLAWLATLASLSGVDLADASRAYADGCPACHRSPCVCPQPATPIGPTT
jgi:NTP pyrophosphatase (non-canonical NTP hydrolase)